MIGVIIWTIAKVINAPLVASVTADLAPRNLRGRYMGTFMATWSASSLVAPLIAGPHDIPIDKKPRLIGTRLPLSNDVIDTSILLPYGNTNGGRL